MAISKTQPMRSAEIDILDKVNELDIAVDSNTTSLGLLTDALGAEVSDRQTADTALGGRIDTEIQQRVNADSELGSIIGNRFTAQSSITSYANALDLFLGNRAGLDETVVNAILGLIDMAEIFDAFSNRFKIGIVEDVEIPASDSVSNSETFSTPFASDDLCIVIAQVITNELSTLFSYTLNSCNYSGFSYSIANSDANAHTVALGYVAIKVN